MNELHIHGYQKDIPAFFSWIAVTHFLTETAVFKTLSAVAMTAPSSEIVFSYILPESLLNEQDQRLVVGGRARTSETWISVFIPNYLAERLNKIGFSEVSDFGPKEAYTRYFAGRSDELSASALDKLSPSVIRIEHLMKATVSDQSQS
jgi:O-methyltransferase involved in polyketide biosynthesis